MRARIPRSRSAFTLVEMLVVITILLVMMGVTVSVINVSAEGERIRSGASQVQSYLAGARDRAAYAGRPCGVRFFLDPLGSFVTSMVYIQVPDDWQQGAFNVTRNPYDNTNNSSMLIPETVNGVSTTEWESIDLLLNTNQLRKPRIMIRGHWYTVFGKGNLTSNPNSPRTLFIRPSFRGAVGEDTNNNGQLDPGEDINGNNQLDQGMRIGEGDYRLRLQPQVMPGQEPALLPAGVVIDLNQCRRHHNAPFGETLPKSWYPPTYLPALDILFSPNGTVVGPEASKGVIHLLVNDVADTNLNLFPIDQLGADIKNQSDKRVVSLFTRSGYVTTSELVPLDAPSGSPSYLTTDNQFYYAERGETE
tara:strand:- start:781 stop:1866 length:1086 start_codon:yes stop_codon:yes gene_type:complete